MSLAAPPKGQDPFHGLPHLQAYRFIRAMSLAEIGHVDVAKRFFAPYQSISCADSIPIGTVKLSRFLSAEILFTSRQLWWIN